MGILRCLFCEPPVLNSLRFQGLIVIVLLGFLARPSMGDDDGAYEAYRKHIDRRANAIAKEILQKLDSRSQNQSRRPSMTIALYELGIQVLEHRISEEIIAASKWAARQFYYDDVARLRHYAVANRAVLGGLSKALGGYGVYQGIKRTASTSDAVEQVLGALDTLWSLGSISPGPVGIVFAAGALGNAIGQWIDDTTGLSDLISDTLYDLLGGWPFNKGLGAHNAAKERELEHQKPRESTGGIVALLEYAAQISKEQDEKLRELLGPKKYEELKARVQQDRRELEQRIQQIEREMNQSFRQAKDAGTGQP